MTPERLDELRQRARKLQSDLNWLADEFAYFADQATDVATAQDLMKWIPVRVWTLLTDVSSAERQINKLAPLSLKECKAASLSVQCGGEDRHEVAGVQP